MNCTVTKLRLLDETDCSFLFDHASRRGSDFQGKLVSEMTDADGHIAVVRDQGEIVAWARTEQWEDVDRGEVWPTLEAFTREPWRRRGLCRYAVAGLAAANVFTPPVAIFRPPMIGVCRHLGIGYVEYEKDCHGEWRRYG